MVIHADFARVLAKRIAGVTDLTVEMVNDQQCRDFQASWAKRGQTSAILAWNVQVLGRAFFDRSVLHERCLALLIHEMAHQTSGDHLSEDYYDAMCTLGARLANLIHKSPDFSGHIEGNWGPIADQTAPSGDLYWPKVEVLSGRTSAGRGWRPSGLTDTERSQDGDRVTTAHEVRLQAHRATKGARGLHHRSTCRNRWCQNPAHWRVITRRRQRARGRSPSAVNARKTHCIRGHELAGRNLLIIVAKNGRKHPSLPHLRERRYHPSLAREKRANQMWVFLVDGFYSAVENPENKAQVVVRAQHEGRPRSTTQARARAQDHCYAEARLPVPHDPQQGRVGKHSRPGS